jgi:protein-S-isoprenylcysteine O-methyltransferase Ste14
MILFGWGWLSSGLLLACLASFSWAIRSFFSQPAGDNSGMKAIRLCSTLFAVLHLAAILETPHVAARQALAAASLYLLALGLFWWAVRTSMSRPLSAVFSPDTPLHLVEHGPYRFIRHPLYSSYLLTWTAGFLATGRLWLVPTVVVMLLVYIQAAGMEEDKFARSPLADLYRHYRASTGMFFPNLVKLIVTRRKEADAASLAQHRA